jgi:hypothetical protein
MKSVENILGYIREAVSLKKIFEIVKENTLKCSLGNKKLRMFCRNFRWYFYIEIRLKYEKYSVVQL